MSVKKWTSMAIELENGKELVTVYKKAVESATELESERATLRDIGSVSVLVLETEHL